MSEVFHGACLCGKLTFDVRDPEFMGVCHCTRCTRWTGSSGSTVVGVAAKNFEVTGRRAPEALPEEKFADATSAALRTGIYTDGGEKYYVGAGG